MIETVRREIPEVPMQKTWLSVLGNTTRADHADLYNQLYAAYARGKDAQELATILGEAALSEEDRKYMAFANKFEEQYISQGYYDNRTIEQTLDLGWKLLSMFEDTELKRIDVELINKYPKESGSSTPSLYFITPSHSLLL